MKMSDFNKTNQRALTFFKDRNYIEAEKLYLQLIALIPDGGSDIYNNLGLIKHHAGDYGKSISYFKKAVEINPHFTEAALNLTIAYNDTEQFEEAEKIFSRAAEYVHGEDGTEKKLDPYIQGKLANEHFRLGNIYFEIGLLDDAEEQYRKTLSMRPNFVDVITRLGITLREKGLFNEAIDTFHMAKTIKPEYTPSMIHLGITYYSNGFLDLAQQEWEAVKKIDPSGKDVKVYLSLAQKKIIEEETP